jgi:hypothetical protein
MAMITDASTPSASMSVIGASTGKSRVGALIVSHNLAAQTLMIPHINESGRRHPQIFVNP